MGRYREFEGFRIPSQVSIYWELEEGPFHCIDLEVTEAEFGLN